MYVYVYIYVYIHIMTPFPHLFQGLVAVWWFLSAQFWQISLEDGAVILEKDIEASEVIDDFSRAILLGTTQVRKCGSSPSVVGFILGGRFVLPSLKLT